MHPLEELRRDLRAFVDERDWDRFHSPKDLAVGLTVEAGELLENFQWRDPSAEDVEAEPALAGAVRDEVADVFLYALLLADRLGFDLVDAAKAKLVKNRAKYPAAEWRGMAGKARDG